MIKKPCCSRFLLHKFIQLKYFWTLFKNVHLQGPCSLKPCISRPYCIPNRFEPVLNCTDLTLTGARFWTGSKEIWDERIYVVKTLSSTVFDHLAFTLLSKQKMHKFWAALVFSFPKKCASQGLTVLSHL